MENAWVLLVPVGAGLLTLAAVEIGLWWFERGFTHGKRR